MVLTMVGALALVACSGASDTGAGDGTDAEAVDASSAAPRAEAGPPAPTDGGGGVVDAGARADGPPIDAAGLAKVKWGKACWKVVAGKRYQAIAFDLVTPAPIALEGTLYLTTTCSAAQGTDNFNDVGATISTGSFLYYFVHHPDETSTSAIWSIGEDTTGCVDYEHAPDCH